MTDETTTEQLAEIEGQAEDTPATEYTPPEGWRVVAVGEILQAGDMWVWPTDDQLRQTVHVGAVVGAKQRYIRRIEPKQPPQPEPVQVREGRWRTRSGEEKNIRSCEPLKGAYYVWPWTDGFTTYQDNGRHLAAESDNDLVEYLGPIEPEPQPEPEPDADLQIRLLQQANDSQAETIGRLMSEARDLNMEIGGLERQLLQRDARIRDLETMHAAAAQAVVDAGKGNDKLRAQAEELRSEVSYVQRLLGESNRKVTQLEDLVVSLRTINDAQGKTVEAAGKQNDALRVQVRILQREADKKNSRIEFLETLNAGNGAAISDYRAQVQKLQGLVDTARGQLETAATEHDSLSTQLEAVKAELVTQAETSRRLQIELDAAHQVPADSPELRQLRADLAEVTQDRDTYRHAHELLLNDVNATHARTKAMTVEAIAEWLEPIRLVDSAYLANATMQHLPQIMRTLTGLDSHAID